MGDRYFLEIVCPKCGNKDPEVYFAPTCGFTDWRCEKCGHFIDLVKHTGITAEMASNKAEIEILINEIVKENKMNTPVFYYLRDEKGAKKATVCLIPYGQNFSRGIALCSELDQFNRDWGKEIAMERAFKGVAILTNAEKPLTEKQVRLGKKNKFYLEIGSIRRGEGEPFLTVYSQLDSIVDKNGWLYKLTTVPFFQLSDYEKKLVNFKSKKEVTS